MADDHPPIFRLKDTAAPSVFAPAALLRKARRQKGLGNAEVSPVCILDPDGDLVRELRHSGATTSLGDRPCYYHTELDTFDLAGRLVGIVGRAVGASFAMLVAGISTEKLRPCGFPPIVRRSRLSSDMSPTPLSDRSFAALRCRAGAIAHCQIGTAKPVSKAIFSADASDGAAVAICSESRCGYLRA